MLIFSPVLQLTSFHEYKAADVGDNEFLRRPGVTPSTCVIGLSISSSLSTSKSPSSSSRPGLEEVDSSLPPVVVLLTSLEGWPYDIRFRRQKRSADKKKTFKKWWNFIDSTYIKAGHIFRVSNKKIITPASNHYHGDKEIRWPVVPSFSDCKVHFMLGEHDSQTHRKPFLGSVQCFLSLL